MPALAAPSRPTASSIALALLPTPCVAPVLTMRNCAALTSVSSPPASLMLCALRLTLPAVLIAPRLKVVPET